jgi:hypothetical protein
VNWARRAATEKKGPSGLAGFAETRMVIDRATWASRAAKIELRRYLLAGSTQ